MTARQKAIDRVLTYSGPKQDLVFIGRAEYSGGSGYWKVSYKCTKCCEVMEANLRSVEKSKTSMCPTCAASANIGAATSAAAASNKEATLAYIDNYNGPLLDVKLVGYKLRGGTLRAFVSYICPDCLEPAESMVQSLQQDISRCKVCTSTWLRRNINQGRSILYYVYLPKYSLYKIGITSKSVADRLQGEDYEVLFTEVMDGKEAFIKEQNLLHQYSEFLYKGPKVLKRKGDTELFTKDILNIREVK